MPQSPANKSLLLVCDIDGTLLLPEGGHPGLEAFNRFVENNRESVIFAVNTGRSLPGIAAAVENGPLARPDWLFANVGSELYTGFDPDTLDPEWREQVELDWDRGWYRSVLAGCPGIVEQEPDHQGPCKLSYYFRDRPGQVLPEVYRRFGERASAVKITDCLSLYLDIIPAHAGKGGAVSFLARRLGIPDSRVITAGDSGNDRDMLTGPWRGIIPANRSADLDDLVGRQGLYFASGTGASGVLEGLQFWKAFPETV